MKLEEIRLGMTVALSTGYGNYKKGIVQEIDDVRMRARVFWPVMKNRTYVQIRRLSAYGLSGSIVPDEKGGMR